LIPCRAELSTGCEINIELNSELESRHEPGSFEFVLDGMNFSRVLWNGVEFRLLLYDVCQQYVSGLMLLAGYSVDLMSLVAIEISNPVVLGALMMSKKNDCTMRDPDYFCPALLYGPWVFVWISSVCINQQRPHCEPLQGFVFSHLNLHEDNLTAPVLRSDCLYFVNDRVSFYSGLGSLFQKILNAENVMSLGIVVYDIKVSHGLHSQQPFCVAYSGFRDIYRKDRDLEPRNFLAVGYSINGVNLKCEPLALDETDGVPGFVLHKETLDLIFENMKFSVIIRLWRVPWSSFPLEHTTENSKGSRGIRACISERMYAIMRRKVLLNFSFSNSEPDLDICPNFFSACFSCDDPSTLSGNSELIYCNGTHRVEFESRILLYELSHKLNESTWCALFPTACVVLIYVANCLCPCIFAPCFTTHVMVCLDLGIVVHGSNAEYLTSQHDQLKFKHDYMQLVMVNNSALPNFRRICCNICLPIEIKLFLLVYDLLVAWKFKVNAAFCLLFMTWYYKNLSWIHLLKLPAASHSCFVCSESQSDGSSIEKLFDQYVYLEVRHYLMDSIGLANENSRSACILRVFSDEIWKCIKCFGCFNCWKFRKIVVELCVKEYHVRPSILSSHNRSLTTSFLTLENSPKSGRMMAGQSESTSRESQQLVNSGQRRSTVGQHQGQVHRRSIRVKALIWVQDRSG
jgi:hypothetical protein